MPVTPFESARSRTIAETPQELKQQIFESFENEGNLDTGKLPYVNTAYYQNKTPVRRR